MLPLRNMLIGALILGLFAVAGTGLVTLTYLGTKERIAENERQALLRNLYQLVDPKELDNDLYNDVLTVHAPELLGNRNGTQVYRARLGGQPVAAVIASIAPDGYSGTIKLLVGIRYDGTLSGVRVVGHRETPGLGDRIEVERSNWILGFNGRSLQEPGSEGWKVKKDGGIFDQFTGATITPRAVVKAVYSTLRYYQQHREALFADGVTGGEE